MSTHVVAVEEDWEMVVSAPDLDSAAPQVTTVLLPGVDLDGLYATFELNHCSTPAFLPGGLGLQLWRGETPVGSARHSGNELLHYNNETVHWTQAVQLLPGQLQFQIKNGQSLSWGAFGGDGLTASAETSLTNLDAYSAAAAVEHSGVGYAGNRVVSLKLLRVRLTMSDGTIVEDSTVRWAHGAP